MSRKEKKIEVQLTDQQVKIGKDSYEGYQLMIGKQVVGEIAELDQQFALVSNGNVQEFHKTLEQAIEKLIESYNLSK
ncbi:MULTISPECIES: DUF2969 domain-containing protein [unclassified Streptococcus]|uniref:DUF2969 domain-containing protein n=1 Tax=unclassified Streptococcus TaxID=2608887 RepID=UPI0018AC7612|nr:MULTISPECIES: DUF2969 domain-containing protein [unclassified Streptococcus]MBF8970619.1 DUF2969 domain-containing protein [Streptococcus sp. NLN76]MBG9366797.1 DUF2969 domain-containing protein [Streptococcus sp. NLN64]MBJ6745243.1 DUF2969 domain-containing protein [Streptococcus sp. 121]